MMEDDIDIHDFNDYRYKSDIERTAIAGISALLDEYFTVITDPSKRTIISKIRTLVSVLESTVNL